MIVEYRGAYGSTVAIELAGELEGYGFINPPIEFRLLRSGGPISEWQQCDAEYHSLLRPVIANDILRTRGLEAAGVSFETRGLGGEFVLLVWRREGTFSNPQSVFPVSKLEEGGHS
jgi:hypothetical protein